MDANSRNKNLDIAKGIAIWLVIWAHSIQYCYAGNQEFFKNPVLKFIHGFDMPLFMMISGYLFFSSCQKYNNKKKIIKKQICHIAYPLLVWSAINWIYKCLYQRSGILYVEEFIKSLYNSLTELWFLWSILIISVLIAVVYFTVAIPVQRIICYIALFFILIFIPGKIEPCKTMNIWMYPYFLVGFMGHEMQERNFGEFPIPHLYKIRYICFVLYPVLLHYFQNRHYIYISGLNPFHSEYGFINQIEIDLFRWLIGYVGIGFFSVVLQQFIYTLSTHNILCQVEKIGRVTLQIYVLQKLFLEEIFGRIYRIFVENIWGGINPLTQNKVLFSLIWTNIIGLIHIFTIYKIIMLIRKSEKLNRFLFGC